jgi:hypothetical protein
MQNARQILSIVTATYKSSWFEDSSDDNDCSLLSDIAALSCRWKQISYDLNAFDSHTDKAAEQTLFSISQVLPKSLLVVVSC